MKTKFTSMNTFTQDSAIKNAGREDINNEGRKERKKDWKKAANTFVFTDSLNQAAHIIIPTAQKWVTNLLQTAAHLHSPPKQQLLHNLV